MSAEDRRKRERARRRAHIVDAAEGLFLRHGYDGATLPAIAAAAGYNRRNLYFYFPDKQTLFLAVVERSLGRLRDRLEAACRGGDDPAAGLEGLARAFFDFAMTRPRELDLIMRYETALYVYDPEGPPPADDPSRDACQRLSDEMAAVVRDVLAAGQRAGRVRADLAPRPLMLLLWGQILGVVQVLRMRARGFRRTFGIDRDRLFDRFVAMVLASLRPLAPDADASETSHLPR